MVSIIIPIYNVEHYLCKCIDSVLAQTYKDIEVILVDDGSPDACPQICDEYSKTDRRIKVIHKENGGLSSARNAGLDIAMGEYIMFVDSDDWILPEMVANMLKKLQDVQADMCLCGLNRVNEKNEKLSSVSYSDTVLTKHDAYELLVQGNVVFIVACAKLYRRHIFDELRFHEGKIHEDEFISHHVIGKCNRIVSVKMPYYQYLQRNGSIIRSLNCNTKWFHSIEAYLDRINYFLDCSETEFADRVLFNTIPLLLSIQKKFPKDNIEAKKNAAILRKNVITLIRNGRHQNLPIISRIGLRMYQMGNNVYELWQTLYGIGVKAKQRLVK